MREFYQSYFTGEHVLFQGADLKIRDNIFDDGESPLKHSSNIDLMGCGFKWKYPLWYANNIKVYDGSIFEMGE